MVSNGLIDDIIDAYQTQCIDFDVYVIAEAQSKTILNSDKRIIHADESEFFSRIEFAEIASAIFNVFGFVKVFYDEISFIEYFIHSKIDSKKCIVYNLSRNGKKQGKKSLIPSFCDLYGIRYTGSNAFVISLLRNKSIYSDILSKHEINVPVSKIFSPFESSKNEILNSFKNKEIIVKNINESASIGLSQDCKILLKDENYEELCRISRSVNPNRTLIQEFISGKECEVLVLQYRGKYHALTPVEIIFSSGYDFLDSETSNNNDYEFDLIRGPEKELICMFAEKAASILEIKDYARFDFRISNNIPYLIDIAGTPYTTRHSSIAYLFENTGYEYKDIYKVIVTCMLSNYQNLNI